MSNEDKRERVEAARKDKSKRLDGLDRMILAATGVLAATFALTANSGFFQWLTQMPPELLVRATQIALLFWLVGLLLTTAIMFRLAYTKATIPSKGLDAQIDLPPAQTTDAELEAAIIDCCNARRCPLVLLALTSCAAAIALLIMLWPA